MISKQPSARKLVSPSETLDRRSVGSRLPNLWPPSEALDRRSVSTQRAPYGISQRDGGSRTREHPARSFVVASQRGVAHGAGERMSLKSIKGDAHSLTLGESST